MLSGLPIIDFDLQGVWNAFKCLRQTAGERCINLHDIKAYIDLCGISFYPCKKGFVEIIRDLDYTYFKVTEKK